MCDVAMDFSPINDDHAIEEIRFAYLLERSLTVDDFDRAKSRHSEIKEDLPAVFVTSESDQSSIEFAFMRPDGTASWSLEFAENMISVVCSRYTRWEKVWSAAERYLNFAMSVVQEAGAVELSAAATMVTDKFLVRNSSYDLSALFQRSDILPADIFDRRFIWHTHNGWLDLADDHMTVHTLRVDCRFEDVVGGAKAAEDTPMAVIVQHSQRFTPRVPVTSTPEGLSSFADSVAQMHSSNKRIMAQLLTSTMADRIGLGVSA